MSKKIVVFLLAVSAVFCVALPSLAMTEAERQALIQQITEQIILLQAQIAQMQQQQGGGNSSDNSWCYTFNSNLGFANSGTTDVTALHTALVMEGFSYSPDTGSTYYTGTASAVEAFQRKYSISPQTGYFGNQTRAKMNNLYGCSVSNVYTSNPSNYSNNNSSNNNNNNNNNNNSSGDNDSGSCISSWSCGSWGSCSDGYKTRVCTDVNNCGEAPDLSMVYKTCTSSPNSSNNNDDDNNLNNYGDDDEDTCVEAWACDDWSDCQNSTQTKTCEDLNNCGTYEDKPNEQRSCTMPPEVDLKLYWGTSGGSAGLIYLDGPEVIVSDGAKAVLKWTSAYVNSCDMSGQYWSAGNIGTKGTASESVTLLPASPTMERTYTITCKGDGGTVEDSITIMPTPDFTVDLKINEEDNEVTVPNGGLINVQWSTANAASCQVTKKSYFTTNSSQYLTTTVSSELQGNKDTSEYYSKYSKVEYILSCKNSSGNTATDSVVAKISSENSPVNVQISGKLNRENTSSGIGQMFDLSWSSSNANSCTASGAWSGTKATSGSTTVTIPYSSSKTFTLTCTGEDGSSASSTTLSVGKKPSYAGTIAESNDDSGDSGDSGSGGNSGSGGSGGGGDVCKALCATDALGNVWAVDCDGVTPTRCNNTSIPGTKPYCSLTYNIEYAYSSIARKVISTKTLSGSECRPTDAEVSAYEKAKEEAKKRQEEADKKGIASCENYLGYYKHAEFPDDKYWEHCFGPNLCSGNSGYFSEACKNLGGTASTYNLGGRLCCKGEL